jgi:hypothetical protein
MREKKMVLKKSESEDKCSEKGFDEGFGRACEDSEENCI